MPVRKNWIPREGVTADVLLRLFQNTLLNPTITLPVYLFCLYTQNGQELVLGHGIALNRLKLLIYAGIVRWINNFFSNSAVNNWNHSKYDWDKEIVVITGGSDGIGKSVALLLAERGARVAILDIQPLTFDPPPNVSFFKCDVTSPEEIASCASAVRSEVGSPTILVNNAGIGMGHPLLNTTEESVNKIFQVNIFSHFRLIREFLPAMVAANHGTVVTVASIASAVTGALAVPYSCTKSAAVALHEGLAVELKLQYNAPKVRTICVCPGFTRTRLAAGIINTSSFLVPWQHPETVAEEIYKKIVSGSSGMVFMPQVVWHLGWILRSLPMWWQTTVRTSIGRSIPKEAAGGPTSKG
ncbi:MAG: hypothetical protein LQ348_001254 [Seirophora lacunosa]|nr:MAG: hypothetical protein LQ344_006594 [Seirophora lacunosa]KAI4204726.1 MAG: hypothetical protein LQ348_001254 [Seirophora lacunosa]